MNAASRRPARSRPRVESLETRQLLSTAGLLDPSFGGGKGYAVGLGVPGTGVAKAVAVQPDGKIVVAGVDTINSSTDQLTVVRLNADGTPDATFGTAGVQVLAQAPGGTGPNAQAVLIQPDGKIVVAGQDSVPSTTPGGLPTTTLRDAVFRINANGTPDATFGAGGEVAIPNGANPQFPRITAAALESDGKIVLAGVTGAGSANEAIGAARLTPDGKLDTTFGGAGTASTPLVINGISLPMITSVAVQADGKVVLGGLSVYAQNLARFGGFQDFEGTVIRFNADGTLDTSFGGPTAAGKLLIPSDPTQPTATGNAAVQGLAIAPDGKIVVGGGFGGSPTVDVVTRLNPDGTYDLPFGTNGQARVPNEFAGSESGLIVQKDGKILLSGLIVPDTTTDKVLARIVRFNADGTLDSTFGNSSIPGLAPVPGITVFDVAGLTTTNNAVAAQPDGKIVVAGYVYLPSTSVPVQQFIVARVTGHASLPANQQPASDFDGDGKSDLSVYLPSIGAFAYRPSAGGPDVVVPFGLAGAGQTIPVPGDYSGSGKAEIAAYLPSLALYAYRPANGAPDVVQPFGIAGVGQSIPAPGDYTGSGKDDIAIYLPSIGAFAIRPAGGGDDRIIPFGIAGPGGSIPAPGDYDGDGKTDLAVYLPSIAAFAYRPSAGGADVVVAFGAAGAGQTIPAPGDYSGSGKAEIAAYLPSLGLFAYRPAGGGPDVVVPFGAANDGTVPVSGDFDGSGRDNIAVFDPNYALFAYRPASGADVLTVFGSAGVGQSIPAAGPVAVAPAVLALSVGPGAATPASSSARTVPSGPLASARRAGKVVVAQGPTGSTLKPA